MFSFKDISPGLKDNSSIVPEPPTIIPIDLTAMTLELKDKVKAAADGVIIDAHEKSLR
jgi:hypothetical protein